MQNLCQRLSHFPEYGRLSQAELSLSVTQPMTIAKLTKALRKIATCFETSSWRGSRMPEEEAVLLQHRTQHESGGNRAHPCSRSGGAWQGLLVAPLGDEWGDRPCVGPPRWKPQPLSSSTETQGSHQHWRLSDVPNSLPPQECPPLTR